MQEESEVGRERRQRGGEWREKRWKGGGGVKMWEETETGERIGRGRDGAAQCCHFVPDLLSAPQSSSPLSISYPLQVSFTRNKGANIIKTHAYLK